MYIPQHFREDDPAVLHALIHDHPFATLVAQQNDGLVASHIPLTFDPQQGPYGTLFGHVALGNQQWKVFDDSQEVLAIFQGPHAYISASWYENPAKSVPTWNYTVVHAYGVALKIDESELFHHMATLASMFETDDEHAWRFQATDEFMQRLARGVVGFAIPIARLEGKFKLSQNRSQSDQERVINALGLATGADEQNIATLMQARLQKSKA
jgi:transcriptional regulator